MLSLSTKESSFALQLQKPLLCQGAEPTPGKQEVLVGGFPDLLDNCYSGLLRSGCTARPSSLQPLTHCKDPLSRPYIRLGAGSEWTTWEGTFSSALVDKLKKLQGLSMVLTRLWLDASLFSETAIMHGHAWKLEVISSVVGSSQQHQLSPDLVTAQVDLFAQLD